MAFDLDRQLRLSNARFAAAINRILERYNHPFEDDLLISMETLTYDTPDGPKQWGEVSTKSLKKWRKKILKHAIRSRKNAEILKQQSSGFEDERLKVHQVSHKNYPVDTSDIGEESDADIVSVRRKLEDIHFQNLNVDDVEMQEKLKVQVDVIVQEDARRIPKWITIAPQESSKGLHLASPVQELIGNQATICRKKSGFGNEYSSSRSLQLHLPGVPASPNTITVPRHQPLPKVNETCYDSILEVYQSADEECSWSNVTLGDLYPGMVEALTRLMRKHFQRKVFEYMIGHYRHKRWHSRKPKLNVTVEKIKGFRPRKLKQALPGICSSSSEDIQNLHFGNNANKNCDNKCSFNNLNGLIHYSHRDANEMETDCSDSNLEHDSASGEGQNVSDQTIVPNVMARMGETFLVEDPLQTTASLKNSKFKESEKLTYKCSSDYPSITSTVTSGSAALHLVKESKTHRTDFPFDDTSGLCSSICNFSSNGNTFAPIINNSLRRTSNTLHRNPEIKIPERGISLQRSHSFSSLPVNLSPSKSQKYEDAFEELYRKLCSKEIQKPLTLTKLPSSSQKLEEKGGLMKNNLSDSVRSNVQNDRAFEKVYQKLCSDSVPKLPGLQRASNLMKYEVIQMSETVNALVNSPVRTLSAIPRVKRLANVQNDLLSSPVKRLKNIPEHYLPPTVYQQISRRKTVNLQTVGMIFSSTCSGNNPSCYGSHNYESQDSGFHASPDNTFLVSPHTSLQESAIADAHSDRPSTAELHLLQKHTECRQRVSRKLSYTDGKDRNPSIPLEDFLIKTHQGALMDCYRENIVL
ncbi:Holliday junction recognition protein isoform X2 [Dromaius novaehollandiae]|uniref:Holliday junction recognition protein n=1 Tax=Dromaius novaehollandiae TaxID=8790 RepID=A0A8C4P419_DRONO|nr:Holliday junction recognition protein isoform X2 [Dromaius novaehollandiae]